MMMYILPLVPVDTSRLVSSFSMRVNGSESVEVFTNVEYALYVDERHLTKSDSFVPGAHYIDRGMAEARPHIENILDDFVNKMMGRIF